LGLRVRIGVLLRLADLEHVLLLAIAAAAGEARAVATLLRRGCVLIGRALVRRIGIGLVVGRLVRRARSRDAQLVAQDRRRRLGRSCSWSPHRHRPCYWPSGWPSWILRSGRIRRY